MYMKDRLQDWFCTQWLVKFGIGWPIQFQCEAHYKEAPTSHCKVIAAVKNPFVKAYA